MVLLCMALMKNNIHFISNLTVTDKFAGIALFIHKSWFNIYKWYKSVGIIPMQMDPGNNKWRIFCFWIYPGNILNFSF